MQRFNGYLSGAKHSVTNTELPLRVAMGNTSGDMDSIVGALCMGYYMTLKTGKLWTPVVNCLKKDLSLSAEIYGHLIFDCFI
jgi:inorganic pyrophosphatase/exopolyphosphatase